MRANYLGSAPPSVHGSRVDLTVAAADKDKGSAIYLGCTPKQSYTNSTWSVSRVASSGGSSLQTVNTPNDTPPVSQKHLPRR